MRTSRSRVTTHAAADACSPVRYATLGRWGDEKGAHGALVAFAPHRIAPRGEMVHRVRGVVYGPTVTVSVAVPTWLRSSVTVKSTVYVPALPYACVLVAPLPELPSP